MNPREFDKTERRESTFEDVEDYLCQVLATEEPERPRSQNREPTKAELRKRYRLDRKGERT